MQEIKPLSKDDILNISQDGPWSPHHARFIEKAIPVFRLKELFNELKKEKGIILQYNGKHITDAVLWCDIETLFFPLIEKEKKK